MVLQQFGEPVQGLSQPLGVFQPAIDIERPPIPFFRVLRLAGLFGEDSQLVPGLSGRGQMTTLLADLCRLPIVPLGLIGLPLCVVSPSELMPGGRFHFGLAQLLKQPQRGPLVRHCLFRFPFRQRDGAETAEVHALRPEIFQFLGDFQSRFVRPPGIGVLTAGAKRIPELRTQRAPQGFHSVARRQLANDIDRLAHVAHRELGPTAHMEASAQPAENHRRAVARRIAESSQNRLEHLPRLLEPALVEQPLAPLGIGDIPRLRIVSRLGR